MNEAAGVSVSTMNDGPTWLPKRTNRSNDLLPIHLEPIFRPAALGYWNRRGEASELVRLAKQLAHKIKAPNRDDPWKLRAMFPLHAPKR